MTNCAKVVPLFDAFVDGELPPERVLDVEEHLESCQECLEHLGLLEAMQHSTRQAVRQAAVPSEAFRSRVAAALATERAREEASEPSKSRRPSPVRWLLAAVPLAAAAAAAAALLVLPNREDGHEIVVSMPSTETPHQPISIADTVEDLLDQLVSAHARPPVPQVTEPTLVETFEPEVGVPVKLPSLATYGARWEGGSVIPMRDQSRAALFRYRLSNRPVTVYVYDARRVPLRAVLEPRVVHNVPIHVGAHRGYSIAAREQRGVGYAVATDLTGDESAEIVAAIH